MVLQLGAHVAMHSLDTQLAGTSKRERKYLLHTQVTYEQTC